MMFCQNICSAVLLLLQISCSWSAAARNVSLIQSRILGGTDADINNAQFVVSVRLRANEVFGYGVGFECGGTLISDNVVLTAAHCLFDEKHTLSYRQPHKFLVTMGNLDYTHADEHTLRFNVKSFKTASYQYDFGFKYDIALMVLVGKVPKDHPTAKPITLINGQVKDGVICQAYGWGDAGNGVFPKNLQVVDLPFITFKSCVAKSVYGKGVGRGMICAGNLEKGGVGTCVADSGGPLVCGGRLVGVGSWGRRPCGQPQEPSVFTHVLEFRKWIKKQVNLQGGTQPKFAKLSNTV